MPQNLNTFASKPEVLAPGKSKLYGFDMIGIWPLGNLTGVPTISVVASGVNAPVQTYTGGATVAAADITFGAPSVNAVAFTNDAGRSVLAGQGVVCQITASAVDGGNYLLVIGASDGVSSDALFCWLQIRGAGQPAP